MSVCFNFIAGLLNEHYRSIEIINRLFDFTDLKDEEKLKALLRENIGKTGNKPNHVNHDSKLNLHKVYESKTYTIRRNLKQTEIIKLSNTKNNGK